MIWKWLCNYFPCKIHVKKKIPEGQYIWGIFPHGVGEEKKGEGGEGFRGRTGSWSHFMLMTYGTNFMTDIFPYERRDLSASVLFYIPVVRELLMWLGCIDASAKTAEKALKEGMSLLIYVGGEKEQLACKYGEHAVVVKKRKGFVRLAVKYGASLIPTYVWGENDLYYVSDFLSGFRNMLVTRFRIGVNIAFGRWGSFVPYQKALNMVVGDPIPTEKNENPSDEVIQKYLKQYCSALEDLFDSTKEEFGKSTDKLVFLD